MRNLKRALSLALASIMVIGMMVTGAGAAFSDQESITNTEAVDVVSILGIINGLPGGNYGPTQLVDRASMSKMITLALSGGVEPVLGTKVKPTYTDIKGTWAESYIEYCSSLGIIAGDGAGKFNPVGSVTGSQAAKMLLVALGYDSKVFGFTGPDWEINVNREASGAGLYEGLRGLQASAPLTRDNAAQMIYNALNSKMMVKTPSIDVTTGGLTFVYNKGKDTMLADKFGVIAVEGIVVDNEFVDTTASKGKTTVTVTNYDKDGTQNVFGAPAGGRPTDVTFNVNTGAEQFGKNVTLFVKPAGTSAVGTKATVIGTPYVNANTKIVATANEVTAGNTNKSSDIVNVLKAEGLKLPTIQDATTINLYVNYAKVGGWATSALLNTDGIEAQYIDNDADGIVDTALFLKRGFGKVGAISTLNKGALATSTLGTLAGLNVTDANETVANFADLGVKVDDYVFYYRANGTNGMYYVEKAEGITVDVTATSGTAIVANGTKYDESSLNGGFFNEASATTLVSAVALGKSAVLYLDKAGTVVYVTANAADAKYLMVINHNSGAGTSWDPLQAEMVLEDGTIVTAQINKVNGKNSNDPAVDAIMPVENAGGTFQSTALIYSYTVNADNKYALTAQPTITVSEVMKNNPTLTTVAGGASIANTNTKFVQGNAAADNFSSYKGINEVPTVKGASTATVIGFSVNGTSNVSKMVFTMGGGAGTNGKNIYVLNTNADITIDKNNNYVYTYKVLVDGVATDLVDDNGSNSTGRISTGLYKGVDVTTKNTFDSSKMLNGTIVPDHGTLVSSIGGGIITGKVAGEAGTKTLFIGSDTKVVIIDDKTVSDGSIGMITTAGDGTVTVMTRASNTNTNSNYNTAGVIYILK